MTYTYQKTSHYFAQVADDIKDLAEQELIAFGAQEIRPAYRGLYFLADKKALYTINFHSRLINRVLAPLITFDCHSDNYLYQTALKLSWEDFFNPSQTFAIFASVSHSKITHSKFAALRLKDAIADAFKDRDGKRPSVDTQDPDVWFNLHIDNNRATISLDTSGGSLHKRGYRKHSVEAPMIETLAASVIQLLEWDKTTPLVDPFCGSGTLLCEAYMVASNMPAGALRKKFGFQKLPDYDALLWKKVKDEGLKRFVPVPSGLISGSDILRDAVTAAKSNCTNLNPDHTMLINKGDIFKINSLENKIIVCNPPYGIRMKANEDLSDFYKNLGDFLKQKCNGSVAFIYFGERAYIKKIGLKPAFKRPLQNGGLDGRLVKYELY